MFECDGPFPPPQLPIPTRRCPDCLKDFPAAEAAVDRGPEGHGHIRGVICPECAAKLPEKYQREAEALQRSQKYADIIQAYTGRRIGATTITDLAEAAVAKFRGVDGMVDLMHEMIELSADRARRQEGKGTKVVLDGLQALAKMIAVSSEYQRGLTPVGQLTDADLEAVILSSLPLLPARQVGALLASMPPDSLREILVKAGMAPNAIVESTESTDGGP